MDYAQFVRKLQLPDSLSAPDRLAYEDLVARAITREDLDDDVRGINASLELIRSSRGGGWPTEAVSREHNFVDLVWHEVEFRDGTSFSYVVRHEDGTYLGCCYLYPMGRRTTLSEDLLVHDVDVSWWVTPEAYERGRYEQLYRALRQWVAVDFGFISPFYSNTEIPGASV